MILRTRVPTKPNRILSENQISALPVGLFDGLVALEFL